MNLTPESHTVYDHFHGDYSNEKYCEFWHTNQSAVESMPTIEVKLKRGQAVIFQGLVIIHSNIIEDTPILRLFIAYDIAQNVR